MSGEGIHGEKTASDGDMLFVGDLNPGGEPLISPIPAVEDEILFEQGPGLECDHHGSPEKDVMASDPDAASPSLSTPGYPVSFVLLLDETSEKAVADSLELVAVSNHGRLWADSRRDAKRDTESSKDSASSACTVEHGAAKASNRSGEPSQHEKVEDRQSRGSTERVIQVVDPPEHAFFPMEEIHVYASVKELPRVGLCCSLVVLDAAGQPIGAPKQTKTLGLHGGMWEVGVFRIHNGELGRWVELHQTQQLASPWALMKPFTMGPNSVSGDTAREHVAAEPSGPLPSSDSLARINKVKNKIHGKSKRIIFYTLTLEDLKEFFNFPRDEVARELGICVTLLKKICRRNGIKQWPYRKIKNIDARISALEHKTASIGQSSSSERLMNEYQANIDVLKSEREAVVSLQDGVCGFLSNS